MVSRRRARPSAVQIQVVLYHNDVAATQRLACAIGAAVAHATAAGHVDSAWVRFGDCSPQRSFDAAEVASLGETLARHNVQSDYEFFDANLGSGGGSNRLAANGRGDAIWVINPDTYPAPNALTELVTALTYADDIAATEARQIPIAHPKAYHPVTGEAPWLSGACQLLRRSAFDQVGGFDGHFFPMYCDDVDLGWRLRLAGWRLVHAERAACFHDKRVSLDTLRPVSSEFEERCGVLARLFLSRRYGRPDVEAELIAHIDALGEPWQRSAVDEFRRRVADGDVPTTIEPSATLNAVANFDPMYGLPRFRY
jgi:hypothetical protein